MHSHFKDNGAPILPEALSQRLAPAETIERYLPWLKDDMVLAQRVSEAWSAVVECREADKIRCGCIRCPALE